VTVRTISELRELYRAIDIVYFDGTLPPCKVKWARRGPPENRKRYIYFGHHWPGRGEITMNPVLAWRSVPGMFVQRWLFHEALHLTHGFYHTPEFHAAERRFVHFAASEAWYWENVDFFMSSPCPPRKALLR